MRNIEKLADLLLDLVAPRVTAMADPCSCGNHSSIWGKVCYEDWCLTRREVWCCDGCHYYYCGCFVFDRRC